MQCFTGQVIPAEKVRITWYIRAAQTGYLRLVVKTRQALNERVQDNMANKVVSRNFASWIWNPRTTDDQVQEQETHHLLQPKMSVLAWVVYMSEQHNNLRIQWSSCLTKTALEFKVRGKAH